MQVFLCVSKSHGASYINDNPTVNIGIQIPPEKVFRPPKTYLKHPKTLNFSRYDWMSWVLSKVLKFSS